LWLLPIGNERYLRLGSTRDCPVLDVSTKKGIGWFISETNTLLSTRHAPEMMYLYTGNGYSNRTTRSLHEYGFVKEYDDIDSLTRWLVTTQPLFTDRLNDSEKAELIRHLRIISEICSALEHGLMESVVRKLTLFREVKHPRMGER
jgi:hypothetical protein